MSLFKPILNSDCLANYSNFKESLQTNLTMFKQVLQENTCTDSMCLFKPILNVNCLSQYSNFNKWFVCFPNFIVSNSEISCFRFAVELARKCNLLQREWSEKSSLALKSMMLSSHLIFDLCQMETQYWTCLLTSQNLTLTPVSQTMNQPWQEGSLGLQGSRLVSSMVNIV